jgi:hypothetical protein
MDPPEKHKHVFNNTVLVVTPHGKIVQLFTPIRAVCIHAVVGIPRGSTVFIEAIAIHPEYKLCYRIVEKWFVYSCFTIIK